MSQRCGDEVYDRSATSVNCRSNAYWRLGRRAHSPSPQLGGKIMLGSLDLRLRHPELRMSFCFPCRANASPGQKTDPPRRTSLDMLTTFVSFHSRGSHYMRSRLDTQQQLFDRFMQHEGDHDDQTHPADPITQHPACPAAHRRRGSRRCRPRYSLISEPAHRDRRSPSRIAYRP